MKLSAALMEAAVSGNVRRIGSWSWCALGVSATIAGVKEPIEATLCGYKFFLNERPQSIVAMWPWLGDRFKHFGKHARVDEEFNTYLWHISDMFEEEGVNTFTLAEYVASIEPECGECNRFECICKKEASKEEEVDVCCLHDP